MLCVYKWNKTKKKNGKTEKVKLESRMEDGWWLFDVRKKKKKINETDEMKRVRKI